MKQTDIDSTFSKEVTNGLKGLLALVIMGSHLFYVIDFPLFWFCNKVGTTAVSLFLFISGYGLTLSLLKSPQSYLQGFFRKRFWKVLKPMLIATILYQLLLYLDSGSFSANILSDLAFKGHTPLPNAWFIFALLYCYISFYIAFSLKVNRPGSIIIILIATVLFILYTLHFHFERAWWVTLPSFVTAVGFACYRNHLYPIIMRWWVMLLMIFGVVAIVLSEVELLLLLSYCFIPLVVVALLGYIRLPWGKLRSVQFLGSISYEIYLLHGIFIQLLRGRHISISSDLLYSIVVITLSILSAYLFHRMLLVSPHRQ